MIHRLRDRLMNENRERDSNEMRARRSVCVQSLVNARAVRELCFVSAIEVTDASFPLVIFVYRTFISHLSERHDVIHQYYAVSFDTACVYVRTQC